MDIYQLLRDPWIIAGITFLATVLALPCFSALLRRIKSLFGVFSGQYLALTGDPATGPVLIEDVKCRHVGDRIRGKIRGVAVLASDPTTGDFSEITRNEGQYEFSGFVSERLFVVSYSSTIPGLQSAGSISLKGDSMGRVFSGAWAGLVGESIESAPCKWVQLVPPISSRKRRDKFLKQAREHIETSNTLDVPAKIRFMNKSKQSLFIHSDGKIRMAKWEMLKEPKRSFIEQSEIQRTKDSDSEPNGAHE